MTNRTKGNLFEQEFCSIAYNNGFYAHNNVQGNNGQPFDVQLCKNDICYQIDCKVCDSERFSLRHVQPNQRTAFQMLKHLGCHNNFIVVKFEKRDQIVFMPWDELKEYVCGVPFEKFKPLERLWRWC